MILYLGKSRAMGGHNVRVRFMCLCYWMCFMRKTGILAVMSVINL